MLFGLFVLLFAAWCASQYPKDDGWRHETPDFAKREQVGEDNGSAMIWASAFQQN